jgi:UDP-2,3-diacylglucosamine pyrophosphatase LpxH
MEKHNPEKKKTHTLIVSDLHLGTDVSQPERVLGLLKSYSFRKLILLGDIFDSLDFRNISKNSLELISHIGKISKEKKVRWIVGNHDEGLADVFGPLMNARIYEVYEWQYESEKYLAIHGHQFDRFLVDNAFLSYAATRVYNFIQKFDNEKKSISHYIKRNSKGWLRLSEKVAKSALRYGKERGADYVFCGHTHKTLEKSLNGTKYYNSGCWTDTPCNYITIDGSNIKIHDY